MTWNHRVIHRKFKDGGEEYAIHEVFYDDKGKMQAVTEESVGPGGESLAELVESMGELALALIQPVVDFQDIPEEGAEDLTGVPELDDCITLEEMKRETEERTETDDACATPEAVRELLKMHGGGD